MSNYTMYAIPIDKYKQLGYMTMWLYDEEKDVFLELYHWIADEWEEDASCHLVIEHLYNSVFSNRSFLDAFEHAFEDEFDWIDRLAFEAYTRLDLYNKEMCNKLKSAFAYLYMRGNKTASVFYNKYPSIDILHDDVIFDICQQIIMQYDLWSEKFADNVVPENSVNVLSPVKTKVKPIIVSNDLRLDLIDEFHFLPTWFSDTKDGWRVVGGGINRYNKLFGKKGVDKKPSLS